MKGQGEFVLLPERWLGAIVQGAASIGWQAQPGSADAVQTHALILVVSQDATLQDMDATQGGQAQLLLPMRLGLCTAGSARPERATCIPLHSICTSAAPQSTGTRQRPKNQILIAISAYPISA